MPEVADSEVTQDVASDATVEDVPTAPDTRDSGLDATKTDSSSPRDARAEIAADAPARDVASSDAPHAVGCITSVAAGHAVFTCDGIRYDVEVPPACVAGGCGLVLDVHGMTMSAEMEDANSGMRALGVKHGFVVVQPNANPAPPQSSWKPESDDAKVHTFLLAALDAYAIDRDRVHMMGFSQGGMMSSRFLCTHAELFASMAPMAGTGCTFFGTNTPSREVHVLYVHGKTDAVVAYSQGTTQRDAMIAKWSMTKDVVVSTDASHVYTRYKSPKGTVLEFIEHEYEAKSFTLRGHCYPGSTDLNGGATGQLVGFGCVETTPFVWGDLAMQFFRDHPRTK